MALFLAVWTGGANSASSEESNAYMPADTSSPRATLKSFIDACNEINERIRSDPFYDRDAPQHRPVSLRILDCIDTSELAEFERLEAAGEAAICLKEILDRVEVPPYDEIPGAEEVEAATDADNLDRWRLPGTRITIARVTEGPQRHEYLFSPGTVGRAVEYYHDVQSMPYRTTGPKVSQGFYPWYITSPGDATVGAIVQHLPNSVRTLVYGHPIWKWMGVLLTVAFGLLLMVVCYGIYLRRSRRRTEQTPMLHFLAIIFPTLAMLVPLGVHHIVYNHLTLRGTGLYVVSFACTAVALAAAIFVIFAGSNRIAEMIIASPSINPRGLNAQLIRITSRLLSLLIAVIVILQGGHYLGIPVTTLLASAGIGGLAVALAAQDTLKNLFGTIMLLSDKPFRVGERIIFGKYDGVVEDLGLRSTRLRLLNGHQATIPNDELARADIENVGRRPYIRRNSEILIPLDTPRDKLETAISVIRETLATHEGLDPDFPPRVYFTDFAPNAFKIKLIYWYGPPNYWDFLAFGEKVNLEIFRVFEEHGIGFSLPFRVTHTSIDSEAEPVQVRIVDRAETHPGRSPTGD